MRQFIICFTGPVNMQRMWPVRSQSREMGKWMLFRRRKCRKWGNPSRSNFTNFSPPHPSPIFSKLLLYSVGLTFWIKKSFFYVTETRKQKTYQVVHVKSDLFWLNPRGRSYNLIERPENFRQSGGVSLNGSAMVPERRRSELSFEWPAQKQHSDAGIIKTFTTNFIAG